MLTTFLYGTIRTREKISWIEAVLGNFQICSSAVKCSKFVNFHENSLFFCVHTPGNSLFITIFSFERCRAEK